MIQAIGKLTVATPGTPVRATVNNANPAETVRIHGFLFQAPRSNVGIVYIGKEDMDRTTLVGVLGMLAIPTDNSLPSFSAALTISPNGLMQEELYVDADEAGDGAILTILVM